MPELPEVETIRRGLQQYLVGHVIKSVEIRLPRIFHGDKENVEGAKVVSVERFGKGLVINLNNGYSIAIHVKMTGQLIYRSKIKNEKSKIKENLIDLPNKFTHVIFWLDSKSPHPSPLPKGEGEQRSSLFYNDIRQFGWVKIIKSEKLKVQSFFRDLGPEFPLDDPSTSSGKNNITIEYFSDILSKSRAPIKVLIMDQKKMAGVGNIYANDALYLAKINPRMPANGLTSTEKDTLYNAILSVLKKGIEEGGSSESTYVNALGIEGNYQNHTLVYGMQGQKCKRDGSKIEKYILAGRGTYICPICQR